GPVHSDGAAAVSMDMGFGSLIDTQEMDDRVRQVRDITSQWSLPGLPEEVELDLVASGLGSAEIGDFLSGLQTELNRATSFNMYSTPLVRSITPSVATEPALPQVPSAESEYIPTLQPQQPQGAFGQLGTMLGGEQFGRNVERTWQGIASVRP